MWIKPDGSIYGGDCQEGDRAATRAELAVWEAAKNKVSRAIEIKAQLAEIDIKSIRPLVEGDTAFLATLRGPVASLRAELKTL